MPLTEGPSLLPRVKYIGRMIMSLDGYARPSLLELFSGTGSVGDCFRMHGWEVVSLDSDPLFSPTICADILTFDYTKLGGAFQFVWASPPCTQYSIARSKAKTPRYLEGVDACVQL